MGLGVSHLHDLLRHIRGKVVARWTASKQVERSILHQGEKAWQIHPVSPGCLRPSLALQVQNRGLKHRSFNFISYVTANF